MNRIIFGVFLISFLGLFLVMDLLQRYFFKTAQWSRKATHIFSGFISFLMPLYLSRNQIIILSIIFVVLLSISKYKNILTLHKVARKTAGEIFYPVSIALIALICLPDHITSFQVAVLILALSDGFAGILGELWPIKAYSIKGNIKSIGGSLTFLIATFIIYTAFHGFSADYIILVLTISIFLTISEFFLIYGTDNLILPVLAGILDIILKYFCNFHK